MRKKRLIGMEMKPTQMVMQMAMQRVKTRSGGGKPLGDGLWSGRGGLSVLWWALRRLRELVEALNNSRAISIVLKKLCETL